MQFPEALEVFCDVARNRSFSQAALARELSQPAVSQVVSQLEKRLGVQLLDRSTRPLHLTAAGQVFYDGCRELLERFAELEAAVRREWVPVARTVEVAAIYSVGLSDMGQCVEAFAAHEPGARVHMEYLHPKQVYEKVLTGAADLGLVSFPRRSSKLTAVPWREEEMLLVCGPRHRLAVGAAVCPSELTGEKYVHFTRDLTVRREVDKFLRDHGAAVEVVLEFDNIESIKKAVEISEGVALLPEPTVRREVASQALVALPLAGCHLSRPLGIIHRRNYKLSAAARSFLEVLCGPNGNGRLSPAGNGTPERGTARGNGRAAKHTRGRNGSTRSTGKPTAN